MTNLDYLYNPDAAKPHVDRSFFFDQKLGFQVIEHGTIFPAKTGVLNGKLGHIHDGVFDSKGEFVKGTSTNCSVIPMKNPPLPNQFNTAPKPSFISECSSLFGGT